MNYLAHIYLSHGEESLILGNYLGDMIKKNELASLPVDVKKGVALHHAIDSYTDSHPEVKKCIKLIRPYQGKYTPVVLDVYFDFLLSRNWGRYSAIGLPEFCDSMQTLLIANLHIMPEHVQKRTKSMVHANFLHMYGKEEGMLETYRRIKLRAKFKNDFGTAFRDVSKYYSDIEASFFVFFSDLDNYVEKWMEASENGI